MKKETYVIGIDYGTDSCRAVIINCSHGEEVASSVFYYPRWKQGLYCDSTRNMFRQHPLDYLEGLESTITRSLQQAPTGIAEKIKGIAIDTTGSTPVAVDKTGTPLALTAGFEENPNAMFVLWKDHTAVEEAAHINRVARSWGGVDYTMYSGGIYSSEWFWAKMIHILREDKAIATDVYSWLEHCDWMPAVLTGTRDVHAIKRSRCAAGHKAMWHEGFDGLPSEEFLVQLDPLLQGIRKRLYRETYTADQAAGTLCKEWSQKLGLSEEVVVGVGAFDAHMGAVGGEIRPGSILKVMGTSTCDTMIARPDILKETPVRGICGQVDGSIIPGMVGLEAGQSGFGDIYAWFKNVLLWPLTLPDTGNRNAEKLEAIRKELDEKIIPALSDSAAAIPPDADAIVALDWMNGRRTPDANQTLTGALTGLTLGSNAPRIFRALVEATAFGARRIVDRFTEEGVPIEDVIAIGGVAKKSPFIMQVMADVLHRPIRVARSEQTVALGAAMCAAVACGIHKDMYTAQQHMGNGFEREYLPDSEQSRIYDLLYKKYLAVGRLLENLQGGDE